MSALVSLMQFDVTVADFFWVFDLIQNVTINCHRGLRAKMDVVLTICLFLMSVEIAFVHSWWLIIPSLFILAILTIWCIAYVLHDQSKILRRKHQSLKQKINF